MARKPRKIFGAKARKRWKGIGGGSKSTTSKPGAFKVPKFKPTKFKPPKFEATPFKPPEFEPTPAPAPERIPPAGGGIPSGAPPSVARTASPGIPPEARPEPIRAEHPYGYVPGETLPERITRMTRRGTLIGKGSKRVRKAMIRVGHKIDAEGFEVGEVITSQAVASSWVQEIYLVATDVGEEVMIEYKDGAKCHYPGTTAQHYQRLLRAGSKGKEVWDTFYRLPYFLV